MQPQSIRRFDLAYLGSIAVYAVAFFLGYDDTVALTRQQYAEQGVNMDPSMLIGAAFVIVLAVSLLLWWLVSSKANEIAKWVLTAFFVIGLLLILYSYWSGAAGPMTFATILSLLSTGLSGVGVYFLFQPDAKVWFDGE